MQHEVKKAQPITVEMLQEIVHKVDYNDGKQLAIWVTSLYGFFLILRKSNLVPVKRQHDPLHQLSRSDIKYHQDVLVAEITWTKTNQFGEKCIKVPIVREEMLSICPVQWLLYMVRRIPAGPQHNLFSYIDHTGMVVPVTYHDLTVQLRDWLSQIGVQEVHHFSSHSLRCGGCTHAFNRKILEWVIQSLGMWASQAYKQYIDVTLESRLKAWYQMADHL